MAESFGTLKFPSLQDMLSMQVGEYFYPSSNKAVTRVPGGWVFGDLQGCCFVPEPPEIINVEQRIKKSIIVSTKGQSVVADLFDLMDFCEVDRVASGGMMSEPCLIITYEGRKSDFNIDTWDRIITFTGDK